MGTISHIDTNSQQVEETLKNRLEDAASIDGLILLSVHKSGMITMDLEGAFSPDPDDLAKLLGYLEQIKYDLYSIATECDDE